ncbi:NUDIX domain-containing protein [Altererythrobacter gangjinensis]|uniref:8-oxo-dGTP diphosphatase n=1 Tax=Pontixanthobacter gangjinensis TaxID=1028742 RepID=A0A6I4SNB2_9SPHN|nr:NUDIX domain-containing protein [Pontixanthobacter gangjinensis]
MENIPTLLTVVAAAFERPDGRWLMHKRPADKHHGGLWEFPGGKVESGETPVNALIREITEELGVAIDCANAVPIGFAESGSEGVIPPIVILLYRLNEWIGEPVALEGGAVGWFTPAQMARLDKPPLDCSLVDRLFH